MPNIHAVDGDRRLDVPVTYSIAHRGKFYQCLMLTTLALRELCTLPNVPTGYVNKTARQSLPIYSAT